VAVFAYGLGGLHEVLDLRDVGVRVTVVHQLIQELRSLPDPLLALAEREIFLLLLFDKRDRLMRVVQPVKFGDTSIRSRVIIAELRFRAALLISTGDKVVPLIDMPQWLQRSWAAHGVLLGRKSCETVLN
jgi:hypothetical protein